MATKLKCQTLYPEGMIEITLNPPDTVALAVEKEHLVCHLDMGQTTPRISRLGPWLAQYTFEGGRGLLRLTALEQGAPLMQVRFLKGIASMILRSGGASHELQAAGLDIEASSVTVLAESARKPSGTPVTPVTPKPSAEVEKLKKRIEELEKLAALKLDELREALKKKTGDLSGLNDSAAQEIDRLEEELAQAQRLKSVQDAELSAARDALSKAQADCEERKRQLSQVQGNTAALEEQIAQLQKEALERTRATRDLSEMDEAAVQATLQEQRQQYLAMDEARALLCTDPVIGCQTVSGLLEESQSRLEEARKRIAAIITLREKINDDVMIAVTGRGKLSAQAEAGEG